MRPAVSKPWKVRSLALGLLLLGVGLSTETANRLATLGQVPDSATPYSLCFVAALVLGIGAGALARRTLAAGDPGGPPPLLALKAGGMFLRVLAAVAAVVLFAATWILQVRPEPPLTVLLVWGASMAVGVFAFPAAQSTTEKSRFLPALPRGRMAALLAILLLAAAARVVSLGRVHPVLSGDEASVARHASLMLQRAWNSDPFGAGVNSSMQLGMLPAGVGALTLEDPIGGPRLPYGIIGTLSVLVTCALAGLVCGGWASLGSAALLAFAPHHVHFSRSSDIVVVDSLTVTIGILLLLRVFQTGSPRTGFLAGVSSGLALYGYGGGRILPVIWLVSVPLIVLSRRAQGRRVLLTVALATGFFLAAAPNLRYAAKHFDDWNGRFNVASVFSPGWHRAAVQHAGSEAKLFATQLRLGTIGLLSSRPTIVIFTGYPMIAPAVLPALGIVGLGWLLGRRRLFDSALLSLVVAGNLAGVVLTVSTPQPQRASSLVPILAVLGGAAIAGLLSLLPGRVGGVAVRSAVAAVVIGGIVGRGASGYPLDWDGYAETGGYHAAVAQSTCFFLMSPWTKYQRLYFHGSPMMYWDFPSIPYFLPDRQAINAEGPPEERSALPPGLHIFCEEYVAAAKSWSERVGLRGIRLAHPAQAGRDSTFVVLVRSP